MLFQDLFPAIIFALEHVFRHTHTHKNNKTKHFHWSQNLLCATALQFVTCQQKLPMQEKHCLVGTQKPHGDQIWPVGLEFDASNYTFASSKKYVEQVNTYFFVFVLFLAIIVKKHVTGLKVSD